MLLEMLVKNSKTCLYFTFGEKISIFRSEQEPRTLR